MTPRALLCRRRREAYGSASGPVRVLPPLPPDFLGVDAEAAAEARLAEAKGGQYNARSAWLASSKLSLTRGCVKEGVQGEAFEQWVGGEQSPEPAPTATSPGPEDVAKRTRDLLAVAVCALVVGTFTLLRISKRVY